ncbi:MAG: autotransporter-associated beta strand repeat-containing protein, partial [Verrucomicrobia bacterium]|nr:autotransporter-associated beta strand repeat-containing protein [Verrucomicrobiota bacterium]
MKAPFCPRALLRSLPLLIALVLFGPKANAANFIRANTTNVINQAGAWVGGVLPGTGDILIWDSTVSTPLNNSNGLSGTFSIGGIIISNPPVTVNIRDFEATSRVLNLRSGGITVTNTQDLIIGQTFNAAMDQIWNVGPGRLLTFENGRTATLNSNVNFIGNLRINRTFDIASNSTFTITTGNSIDSETNGAVLLRVGGNIVGGNLVQRGGSVLLGRSNGASIFVVGQTVGTVASYTFSGGTNNTRLNDLGTAVIAGNTNVVATMTMTSNAQFLANGMTIAGFQTSSASLFMSGNAFVSANGAVVAGGVRSATNTITMGGTSLFQANSNFTLGSGPYSVSTFSLSNNAQFGATAAVLVASSTSAVVTISTRDSAQFLMVSNFTVASNAAATLASVTITASNSSLITAGGLAIFGSATNSTCIVNVRDTAQFLIGGNLTFGAGPGSTSAVALNGSAIMSAGGNVVFVNNNDAKGTFTISNNAQFLGGGALTLAGTSVNAFTNGVATVRVADNGVLNIGGPASTSIVGSRGLATLTISNNAAVTFSNILQLSSTSGTITGTGIVNLDGGTLSVSQITRGTIATNVSVTNANLNLNGGVLRALTNSGNFMPIQATTNPTPVNVMAGGVFFDTQSLLITNFMPFLHGTGVNPDGGLVKLGSGNLYMLGTNTWSGPTIISNGTLVFSMVHAGGGAVQVRDGTVLEVRVNTNSPSLVLSGLTAGSTTGATLNFDTVTNGSPLAPMIIATNLAVNGTVNVNIRAAGNGVSVGTITLIDYEGAVGGTGAFNLASLPAGVVATLVTNDPNTSIDLSITLVPLTLKWSGLDNATNNGSWLVGGPSNWTDTATLNPAIYGEGSFLSFDDSALGTTAITLDFNANPGGIVLPFSNNVLNYSITGSGSMNGFLDLTKDGTGTLTMGVTNNYFGNTSINAGTFKIGTNEAIPHGSGKGDLILNTNGTLDLNGFTETVNGFDGAGVVDNTAATPAIFAFATNGVAGLGVVNLGGALVSNYHIFSGTISNSGGGPLTVAKVGGGNNIFTGTNTYTGTNIITAGILAISNGNALGSSANPLVIGSTLFLPTGVSYTNTAPITTIANSTFTVQTNAAVFLTGNIVPTNVVGYSVTVQSNGNFVVSNSTGFISNLLIQSAIAAFTGVTYTNTATFRMGRSNLGIATVTLDNTIMLQTNSGGRVDVGEQTNSVVVLYITNNSKVLTEDFFVGKSNLSIATVYQSSGVVSNAITGAAADWRIGGNAAAVSNSIGTYNLSGGRFDVLTNFQIGYSATGLVQITGGSMNSWGGTPSIGRSTNSTGIGYGSLTVAGGSFNSLGGSNFIIGEQGQGDLVITNTGLVTAAGPMMIARSNTAIGTVSLYGGNLQVPRAFGSNGVSTFRFLGGTLGAITSTNNFMSSLSTASVASAGAFIDTSNFTVTINQQLTEDPASAGGGLTKLGPGNLILNGSNNTHTGGTAVSVGRLFVTPSYSGPSIVTVADNAGFGVQRDVSTNSGRVGTVNMGTGGASTLILDLGTFLNPTTPVARVTNFTANGAVTVNVTNGVLSPGTITLVKYDGTIGGGSIVSGSLPPGVTGIIADNPGNTAIELNITAVDPLSWSGAVNNIWDTNTLNWQANAAAAKYQDFISRVLFDDTALGNTNVSLLTNFSPASVVVSNNTLAYSFAGPGRIAGTTGLTKLGTNSLTLLISNNYSGQTFIGDGSLKMGTNNVLRYQTNTPNLVLSNNGTLDLNGFSQTVSGLDGNGFIDNTAVGRGFLTLGTNVATGSFGGTIQDTVGDLLVIKLTTNDYTLNGNNTWSGGMFVVTGRVFMANNSSFGVGPLIMNPATTLTPTNGTRTLTAELRGTNNGTVNIDTTFADLIINGPVNFDGPELGKQGAGTLRFASGAVVGFGATSEIGVFAGALVIDGASVTITNDGYRLRATTNTTSVISTLTNNGTLALQGAANFVIGATANTAFTNVAFTNTFTMSSGLLVVSNGGLFVGNGTANAGTFHQNGGLITFSTPTNGVGLSLAAASNTLGVYNLNAGTLVTSRIIKSGGTNNATARFVFNGGFLQALNSSNNAAFMTGLDQAIITTNHAWIDSSSNSITIGQSLIPDTNATGGGLIKLGVGSLTLAATNTYTNLTDVREGKLFITPAYAGPSVILASNTAGFGARRIATTNAPAIAGTVTLAGLTNTLDFDLGTFGNPTGAVARVTNFTASGSIVTVNVTGLNLSVGSFTLLSYVGTHGNPTLVTGSLPPGVTATVVDNLVNSSIDLSVTAITPLIWDGTNSGVWDIGLSTNWLFLGSPTVYGDGSPVVFDDTANGTTDVTLFSDVTPGGMLVSNDTKTYSFGVTNRILGAGGLTKLGAALLKLGTSNAYTGGTFIGAGTVQLQTNNVIPNGANFGLFTVNGVFDLNGFVETVNGLNGSGTVNSTGVSNTSLTIGSGNSNGAFSGVIQNTGVGALQLIKTGTGTNVLSGANTYSGGTSNGAGGLGMGHDSAFGTNAVILNQAATLLTAGGARTLANALLTTTNAGTANIDTSAGDLIINGPVSWDGPELAKLGSGTLRFAAGVVAGFGAPSEIGVFAGALVIDGASVTITNDGFRLRATTNGSTVTADLTNNGTLALQGAANFVVGATANTAFAVPSFTNTFTMSSGLLSVSNGGLFVGNAVANAGTFNHNGGLITFSSFTNTNGLALANATNTVGVYNLNAGTLVTPRVRKLGGTNNAIARFVFNGGILQALNNSNAAIFLTGLDEAIITTNHAWIDSSSNSVTISQPLIPDTNATGGGLIKLGTGSLTLSATNTYTNLTQVREGKLFITPTYLSSSVIIASNTAGFGARRTTATNGPATTATVTLAGLTNTLDFDLGSFGNPPGAIARVTNFNAAGSTVTVNVTGVNLTVGTFTLLDYDGVSGSPTLVTGSLPPGVSGTVVDNLVNSSIDLTVTAITPLVWDGTNSGVWDIGLSTNWLLSSVPALYVEGSPVLFDDTANGTTTISLLTDVQPGGMTVSNVTKTYTFASTNRILGSSGLTKLGSGVLRLGTTNDYTAGTLISAGTLQLRTNDIIPNGAGRGTFTVNGTFDLNGFNETINGLDGGSSGVVNNTGASNSALTIGSGNSNGAFSGVIQNTGSGKLQLIKTGTGTNILSGASTYSGVTSNGAGGLGMGHNSAFGTNTLIVNQTSTLLTAGGARTLTNALLTTTATGTVSIDTTGGDLLITGPVTWTAPDLAKRGPNTLTFGPAVVMNMDVSAEIGVRGGSLVVDGSTIVTGDGFRLFAVSNAPLVTATMQNNATVTLYSNANFIVGRQDDTNFATPVFTNIFTITSGTLTVSNGGMFIANNIANTGIMNQNGGAVGFFPVLTNTASLDMAAATNTLAIYNLNAGTLTVGRVRKTGAGTNAIAQFNFGGGTLVALNNSNGATFMQGLDQVLVRAANAKIDTSTNVITVNQPLLEDTNSPGGGLIKTGTGSLTLTATNTYTNVTAVNFGKLFVASTYVGPSVITVADGAGFGTRRVAANATAIVGTVNLGAGGATTLDFDLGIFGDSPVASAQVTNFTATGTVTVNVSGLNLGLGTITLLTYSGVDGSPTVLTGTLPPGVSGSVVDTGSAIQLTVTGIDYLTWDGTQNSRWDLASTNWLFLAAPKVYTNASAVLFKDSPTGGAGSVVLTNDVTPGSILVSNTATTTYTFSGTNRIQGATRLTKLGTGTLVMAATNNETGQITIGTGVLKLGTNDVFRHAAGTSNIVVTNTGVFDLNGFLEVLTGVEGNGTIDNTAAGTALLVLGTNAGTATFAGTIQDTGGDLLLKKSGTGVITLTGSNTWNGGTLIAGGTLALGNDNAFGVGLVTMDGAVLGTSGGARTLTNTLTTTTNSGTTDLNTDGGNLTLTGPVNWLVPNLNKQGSNTLTFAASSVV